MLSQLRPDILIFIFSFASVLWAIHVTGKHYLSTIGRYEDYYFLLTIISVAGYYVGNGISLLTNKVEMNIVLFTQMQLIWGYWFLMMFSFKQNHFKHSWAKRLWYIFLTVYFVYGNTGMMGTIITMPFPNYDILNSTTMPILMKVDYVASDNFILITQTIKVSIIVSGAFFAYRTCMGFSWMFFAFCFLFCAELLTYINANVLGHPCLLIFNFAQLFVIATVIFAALGMKEYFKKRVSNGK